MPEDGSLEALARPGLGKVERGAPAPFIKLSGKVIVRIDELSVALLTGLQTLFGLVVLQVVVAIDLVVPVALFGGTEFCAETQEIGAPPDSEGGDTGIEHPT